RQAAIALIGLAGRLGGGSGRIGLGAESRSLAADEADERLAGPDRLTRRDENPLDATSDGSGDRGAGIDHRFDATRQAGFAPATAADADDRDARRLDLCSGQFDPPFGLGLGGLAF